MDRCSLTDLVRNRHPLPIFLFPLVSAALWPLFMALKTYFAKLAADIDRAMTRNLDILHCKRGGELLGSLCGTLRPQTPFLPLYER